MIYERSYIVNSPCRRPAPGPTLQGMCRELADLRTRFKDAADAIGEHKKRCPECAEDISDRKALSLLREWKEKGRLIHAGIQGHGQTVCSIVGRIEEVSSADPRYAVVRIAAKSGEKPPGQRGSLTLCINEVYSIRFVDWRKTVDNEADSFSKVYGASVFAELFKGWHCAIHAVKTDEFGDWADQAPPWVG